METAKLVPTRQVVRFPLVPGSGPWHDAAVTTARRSILTTSHGTRSEAFGPGEWGLFLGLSAVWGASFLFMAEGLEVFEPGLVTLWRVGLGAVTMLFVPGARAPVDRADWPRLMVIGTLWLAVPFTLFPIAQQWIDSAVAGMLNGAMPIWTAVVAFLLLRDPPGRWQVIGLTVGFVGVIAIGLPSIGESDTAAIGVLLVVAATLCYAVSANIAAPLQQRYGAIPIAARAQWVAVLLTLPYGVASVPDSSWGWSPFLAMVAVGVIGTGIAFGAMSELVGRVGPTRASTITYVIPVVSLALGVWLRDESIAGLSILGCALVIAGAVLASRRER